MKTTKNLPTTNCPHCKRVADAATDMTSEDTPEPGAISVCIGCGGVSLFAHDMSLRHLTEAEWSGLRSDTETYAEVRRHQRAVAKLASTKLGLQ